MKISKERLKYEFKEHLADTNSILTLTFPINTGIELFGSRMSDDVSLNSRILNVGIAYGGLTRLAKLRDYTIKRFDIENKPSYMKTLHDIAYGLVLAPTIKTGIYLAKPPTLTTGEIDWASIGIGTVGTTLAIVALMGPIGWMVDVGRDLRGVKESKRTPNWLKYKSKRFKKNFANAALATSIAIGASFYTFNNPKVEKEVQSPRNVKMLEQLVQGETE